MFVQPSTEIPYRIMGIDPGTSTLGVCILDLYLSDGSVELVDARTFDVSSGMSGYSQISQYQGDVMARLAALKDSLTSYLLWFRPIVIASESPYMGRFPAAFRALTQCLLMIQWVGMEYDPLRRVNLYDPMTVKSAVGVHAKGYRNKAALAKEHVRAGVEGIPFRNSGFINFSALDEHSIDAIAVAMARVREMFGS